MKAKLVKTQAGSFPKFPFSKGLKYKLRKEWQVLCGDKNHWRVGYYSPWQSSNKEVKQLEKHNIPELFLLLKGEITLIMDDGDGEYEMKLKQMEPVVVKGWHCGYCPDGAYTGISIVVERDKFSTIYRSRG